MTNFDWDAFDATVDTKGLSKEVKELKSSSDYPEIPCGKYEVALEKLQMKQSKKGNPMLSAQMKIVQGKYENQKIFMNQVLYLGNDHDKFRLSIADKFLKSLETGLPVGFETFKQYAQLIEEIFEKAEGCEFLLDYGENKDGYKTYNIVELYD